MPTIPFNEVDVLVLDRQGKDISGQGLDTNVIGRRPFAINESEPDLPDIKRIFVRGLTETTPGNAMGLGSADFVHADIAVEFDSATTLINAITASTIRGVRLPPIIETDKAGLVASLSTIGVVNPEDRPHAQSARYDAPRTPLRVDGARRGGVGTRRPPRGERAGAGRLRGRLVRRAIVPLRLSTGC